MPASADEIGRLAVTMNDMLDRLEAARTRQMEFVADASHELQSPLTAFRAQLEVALAHPRGLDWPELAFDLLIDGDRMERLVHDLLFLAKEDSGQAGRLDEPVDLEMVVLEEVAQLRSRTALVFDTSRVSPAPTQGNRQELSRLVRNVVENAARYADSQVVIELEATPGKILLAVSDDGPGVPVEQRERIFERFARVEGARARSDGGTGLGLAIARSIAERHGGTISLDTPAEPAGARFVIQLPPR
ncbi:MAG: HAMP domain-containing sensor histidine kinase [Nocardioidaceae bacterium]